MAKFIQLLTRRFTTPVPDSLQYWEQRYSDNDTSTISSYGILADYKADVLNDFVSDHQIKSVIEFGCGDGNQLSLAFYPSYIGLDVSKTALKKSINEFKNDPTKSFYLYDPFCFLNNHGLFQADLAISLDVVYHLVENDIYDLYLKHLFDASNQYVIIYSSNTNTQINQAPHIYHRHFTADIESRFPQWTLDRVIYNKYSYDPKNEDETSFADFYVFRKLL